MGIVDDPFNLKRFVEAQGGSISLDCPPGGGTTVVVTFPLDRGR